MTLVEEFDGRKVHEIRLADCTNSSGMVVGGFQKNELPSLSDASLSEEEEEYLKKPVATF